MANILVVDDDPDLVNLLAITLSSAGHDVVTEGDPRRAFAVVEANRFDAVVLDVMMPGLSGWDLLERLRANPATRRLPLVMLSALDSASNRVRGLRSGADDYMGKPFEPAELVARIERLLSRVDGAIPSLQGRLEDCGILEMAQTLEQNRKSGELRVLSGGMEGLVLLRRGVPFEAKIGQLTGDTALRAMIELEEGSFSFEAGPADQPEDQPNDSSDKNIDSSSQSKTMSFGHLGMDVAWFRDELHRRAEWLPDDDQPLIVEDSAWTSGSDALVEQIPKDFANLPIEEVFSALGPSSSGQADGEADVGEAATLNALLALDIEAPTSIRLAVAWLIEQEIVVHRPADDSEAVPTVGVEHAESLDMGLRELFQLAVLSDLPIDPVEVVHFVDPDAWGLVWPLLQRLPDQVFGRDGSASRMRLLAEKRGTLRIDHASGSLRLWFETVREDDLVEGLPERAAAGILWLPSGLETYQLPIAALRFAEGAGDETPWLAVASESGRSEAEAIVAKAPGWRLAGSRLATLEALVTELTMVEAI